MTRDNGSRIAFIEYDADKEPVAHIRYTRRNALDEGAIINVSAKICDGKAKYWHRFSQHSRVLANAVGDDEKRALRSLLDDEEYRNAVLDDAVSEFAQYRSTRNVNARMIVVVLAISDEKDSHRALHLFRTKKEAQILVSVYMAQEGFDVPECTHLVALTPIRSRPWLEQALSRVTRFDPECGLTWEEQCAFLYVPSDHSMVSFLSEWINEQDARFNDAPDPTGAKVERTGKSTFAPISGELTSTSYADTYGVFSEPDQRRIALVDRKLPYLTHLPAVQRLGTARMIWPHDDQLPSLGEVAPV